MTQNYINKQPEFFSDGLSLEEIRELPDDLNLDLKKLSITDLLKIEELQKLQDAFASAHGVASTITDRAGNPVTKPSNHTGVCSLIRNTERGLENCIKSSKALGQMSLNSSGPNSHHCLSIGFVDAAAPVVIDGVHIANWMIGQSCIGNVNEDRVAEYAEEIGADKEKMVEAFREIDPIPEDEFMDKVNFLWVMAGQISRVAFERIKLYELFKAREKVQNEVSHYKNDLQKLVEDRTQLLNERNAQLKAEIESRVRGEMALAASENRYRSLFEESKDAIFGADIDGNVKMLNPAGMKLFGISFSEGEKINFNDLFVEPSLAREFAAALVEKGEARDFDAQLQGADGQIMDCMLTITAKKSSDGTVEGYEGIVRDVTPYKRMEDQLRQMATSDPLTGINNRRNFMELAQQEIGRCHRYGKKFALLMLDIDHFKKINDSYGHFTGDQVLIDFCKLCAKEIRGNDIIGRLGGEEFAIACLQSDAELATSAAERIREAVESELMQVDDKKFRITVSIGVSEFRSNDTLEDLLERADNALYQAKENGRNQIKFFS